MHNPSVWAGEPSVVGSSEATRMVLLTLPFLGLQFTWGMEMTYCTPYLLELGLTKSKTSLVWIAGPLSGLIVAPVVGAIADRSKSTWGRRRPFMIGGTVAVLMCLIVLGWAREIVHFFFGPEAAEGTHTVFLAVMSIYVLDFAINTVQWSSRSLIVDILPISKQQAGSAWASRAVALGHCLGYMIGALDMEMILGNSVQGTQFKTLLVIAAFALVSTVSITTWAVTEKVLISDGTSEHSRTSPINLLRDIFNTMLRMPRRMKAICWAVFWAWIGWFIFSFYSATWIGEIALQEIERTQETQPQDRMAIIGRKGSTALVWFSAFTFLGSVVLPKLVQSPEDENLGQNSKFTPRPPPGLSALLKKLRLERLDFKKPSLVTAWLLSHCVFAFALGCTVFVSGVGFAKVLVGLCGLPSALANWAPHAFMGFEINKLDSTTSWKPESTDSDAYPMDAHARSDEFNRSHSLLADDEPRDLHSSPDGESRSGVYLGILNVSITIPQFLGALISAVVFWIFESPNDGVERKYNSISICFVVGGIAALGAAYATSVLKKMT